MSVSEHSSISQYGLVNEEVKDLVTKTSDKTHLLDEDTSSVGTEAVQFRVYWNRWYILFQFSLLSLIQTAIAGTWSPISLSATKALGFTKHDFDLLANWGVAGLMIFLPFDIFLLKKFGLRFAVLFGAVCVFVGSGIRCIPSPTGHKYLIHAGQFLNGVGGCPVMSCAPFLSNTWFPLSDRILATAIMLLTGTLGPYFVQQPNNVTGTNLTDNTELIKSEIQTYMLIEWGIAALLFILMVTYFPNRPPTPPSVSAATERIQFLVGIKSLLKNGTYWSIGYIYVAMVGGFYGWMGVAAMLFESKNISQKAIGLMTTVASASGMVAGMLLAWIADRLKKRRSILWILSVLIGYIACMYTVAISLNWIHVPPFLFNTDTLWVAMVTLGVVMSAIQPLAMEMWADAAYPIDEGTATSIPVWISMCVMVIYFTVLSRLDDQDIAFYIMAGMMTSALPFLHASLRTTRSRMEVDLKS